MKFPLSLRLFLFPGLSPGFVLVEAVSSCDLEAVGDLLLGIVAVPKGFVEESSGMALFERIHNIFALCWRSC